MKRILILYFICAVNLFGQQWWNGDWQSRIRFTVTKENNTGFTSLKLQNTGRMKNDGNDFRAVDDFGNELKLRVYPDSPTGLFLVAVKTGELNSFYLYYGNPGAQAPPVWNPDKGLLLSTYPHKGAGKGTWEDFNQLFKERGPCMGRDFVKAVFHGYNPFGQSDMYLSVYSGKFYVNKPGKYLFSTVSDDSSFLFVDGNMIVSWAGQHNVWGGHTGRFRKEVLMKKGNHPFRYCHIDYWGDQVAAAYIQRPGQKKLGVLWFPLPDPCKPVKAENKAGEYEPVVDIREAGEIDGGEILRLVAVDFTASQGGSKYMWDTGDGNKYKGRKIRHLYLSEGEYPVTLSYTEKGKQKKLSMIRRVTFNGARKSLRKEMDFMNIIAGYDYKAAGKKQFADVLRYGVSVNTQFSDAFLKQADEFVGEFTLSELIHVGKAWVLKENFSKALYCFDKGLERFKKKEDRARLLVEKGDLYFYYMKSYPEAIRTYREVTRNPYLKGWGDFRLAFIRLGDVYRERRKKGDYELAFTYYTKAEDLNTEEHIAKSNGYFTHSVLELIGKNDFANALSVLEKWEFNFPTEKLNGFSSLLRARINFLNRKYEEAEKQALNFIGINPTTTYLADYYMLIGAARYKQDNPKGALEYYLKVGTECPESPKREKAADLAGAIQNELKKRK